MGRVSDDHRRRVPRTDTVLADARLEPALATLGRARVKEVVVAAQGRARAGEIAPEAVADEVVASLPRTAASMRPVLNATGVLLHTNLGRAPLSAAARDAIDAAAGTTDVELDLATGGRGRRGAGALAALAATVPDAGGVHVVNNGAAALILAATALAAGGREIVIARGEMVEIGDGFRLPDLLESTGARLREVGTTNRVRVDDYADAVGPRTGMILKVHPSNFVVTGFTSSVPASELTGLGVPVVADIGSGLLAPHPLLPDEPDAATELRGGVPLVTASGDKLLGGPQAGLLLGDADLVHRLRRHPLARALRVDKLTLAALEATLRGPEPPVRAMLAADVDALRSRAGEVAAAIGEPAAAIDCAAQVGGGGAPGVELPSAGVALPAACAAALRAGADPVVARVEQGRCVLDLRSVPASEDGRLVVAVRAALAARA
ncbi:L-seryl-tRNA(Sec) selenium transferase [Actinomycetospora lemnae]|uniref:L-seryl-tRNA(Sec) selenium transferase n=1 Tax=Actinomycetospora lemnae TaxID=3019891 RepID=A0ABT5SS91_9PSEU|nr:L-seryl-tRNA(Sec) selenium transferase [Actinomycetospora sp. DW7H6]MDD7965571.1 L-seryl-tRNA(Sec) selenium transferase [Actinomycetospora sp. DW7H6]